MSDDFSGTATNNLSQFINPTSFLFGNKSSSNPFDKTVPNALHFGSKPFFGSFSTDSTKTDDAKSTNIFGVPSTVTSTQPIFGSLSATGSKESQYTAQSSLFSKTDDNKSNTESLFNFNAKTDGPFKFDTMSKDTKSVFGLNLFGANKEKPAEGLVGSKSIYILSVK